MKFTDIETKRVGTQRAGGRAKLGFDEIRVSISKPTSTSRFPTVRFVIGQGVIDQLRWVPKDKIKIQFNKTQVFIKRDSDDGSYMIQRPGVKNMHRLGFPAFPGMPFADIEKSVSSQTATWLYHDSGLLIDWPKGEQNGS